MKDSFASNEAPQKDSENDTKVIPPCPFKVGDKVRRKIHINSCNSYLDGSVCTVYDIEWNEEDLCYYLSLDKEDHPFGWDATCYELVESAKDKLNEDTSNLHPHHDLIIAWAKGAEIEYWDDFFEDWLHVSNPAWGSSLKFRIKPEEPKKETIKYRVALFAEKGYYWALSTTNYTRSVAYSCNDNFVRWLTDWVEVEV